VDARDQFWPVFGAALFFHLVADVIATLISGSYIEALIGVVVVTLTLCLWADKAPRGAAIGLVCLALIGLIGAVVAAFILDHKSILAVGPAEAVAALLGVRAVASGRRRSAGDHRPRADEGQTD
jgi:membrane associated rhomboid family serine protease